MRESKKNGGLMKGILQVKQKQFLTKNYVRVVLEGEDIINFEKAKPGDNNKILVPRDKGAAIVLPDSPSDFSQHNRNYDVRTYTLRALDLQKGEMIIDFVAHGHNGPASAWAIHALPGDMLGVMMKDREKTLVKEAEQYVLAGDHTALPVLSVILEKLPASARGTAYIEVFSKDDILKLEKPENVTIEWLFNNRPGISSQLPTAIGSSAFLPFQDKFVFAAAEASAVREIQFILRNHRLLERNEWQAYAYWKYGHSEDHSSKEIKRVMHQ